MPQTVRRLNHCHSIGLINPHCPGVLQQYYMICIQHNLWEGVRVCHWDQESKKTPSYQPRTTLVLTAQKAHTWNVGNMMRLLYIHNMCVYTIQVFTDTGSVLIVCSTHPKLLLSLPIPAAYRLTTSTAMAPGYWMDWCINNKVMNGIDTNTDQNYD